jgi:pyridoxal phosphate enzyme (YggS family)
MGDMTLDQMRENVREIRERIAAAAKRAGRRPEDITLLGVSKFQPLESLYMALDCGITVLGENRVQEREQKALSWSGGSVEWHMIGHLQRNKAKKAVELFNCIQSVDSFELALSIEKTVCERLGSGLRSGPYAVMIEVNASGEESKNGAEPGKCVELIEKILKECPHLEVDGLMTIGSLAGERECRASFALLRSLAEGVHTALGLRTRHLSMGMSGDFETAIEEGGTLVRIGTGIFGARHV